MNVGLCTGGGIPTCHDGDEWYLRQLARAQDGQIDLLPDHILFAVVHVNHCLRVCADDNRRVYLAHKVPRLCFASKTKYTA